MNAIEITNLTKNFGAKQAVNGLNMTVPVGSIYGFIGENGSGKSTTEKILCGLLPKSGGSVKLFGNDLSCEEARAKIGVLIESPGCFANLTVWNNLQIQAANLGLQNPEKAVREVLKLVRMEGAAGNKYKNCSLGMKQRIGIAMALLGDPELLVLDEPINGLDADGMRIVREVLQDVTKRGGTVLISSHILGELEKIATHYGIIRGGKMLQELTAEELEASCPTYTALKAKDMQSTERLLRSRYARVEKDEKEYLRVYDEVGTEDIVQYLYKNGITVCEVEKSKIGLEEYYVNLTGQNAKRAYHVRDEKEGSL